MSYCLNPACPHPHNPDHGVVDHGPPKSSTACQSCGATLGLGTWPGHGTRYRVVRPIGAGGFGRTFLAEDRAEQQPCVIKQLLPTTPATVMPSGAAIAPSYGTRLSPADRDRFQAEAQQLDTLGHHPQIPRLYEGLEYPTGPLAAFYLVQEYIAGPTLAETVQDQGPWSAERVRSLLNSLLPVLDYIHYHRVIHRDIKPQNIIQPSPDSAPVLVDFGAAKRTSYTAMARTGTVIGSAGYAAPEQTMGKAVYASDLYSLGVTCLHLLTGMHPFDLYSVSQDEWVWTQYLTQPVDHPLQQILNRLVQRAVNQRYRTAKAVLADLQALPAAIANPPLAHPQDPSVLSPHATPRGTSRTKPSLLNRVTGLLPTSSPSPAPTPPWLAFQRSTPQSTNAVPLSPRPTAPSRLTTAPPPASHWTLAHQISHSHSITALCTSADGTLLASGDRQGKIQVWNLATATLLHTVPPRSLWQRSGHGDRITALQFTPDGTLLLSSSADGTLKQWNWINRTLHRTLEGEGWVLSALALHPREPLMGTGGANGAIDLWDGVDGQFIERLWTHTDSVNALVMAADGHTLISGGGEGRVYIWDMRTAEAIASFQAHLESVSALALCPGGQVLISGGGDRTLRFWDLAQGTLVRTLDVTATADTVAAIALHPSGSLLACPHHDTQIRLWRLTKEGGLTDKAASQPPMPSSPQTSITPQDLHPHALPSLPQDWQVTRLLFSPRGDRLISGSSDGTLKIWQPA